MKDYARRKLKYGTLAVHVLYVIAEKMDSMSQYVDPPEESGFVAEEESGMDDFEALERSDVNEATYVDTVARSIATNYIESVMCARSEDAIVHVMDCDPRKLICTDTDYIVILNVASDFSRHTKIRPGFCVEIGAPCSVVGLRELRRIFFSLIHQPKMTSLTKSVHFADAKLK